MSVTVWPTPAYEGVGAVSLLPVTYSNGLRTVLNEGALSICDASNKTIAIWAAGAWQRMHQ